CSAGRSRTSPVPALTTYAQGTPGRRPSARMEPPDPVAAHRAGTETLTGTASLALQPIRTYCQVDLPQSATTVPTATHNTVLVRAPITVGLPAGCSRPHACRSRDCSRESRIQLRGKRSMKLPHEGDWPITVVAYIRGWT